MAISSRQKGAGFETKICNKLEQLTGQKWERTPGSGAAATKGGSPLLAGDLMCPKRPCLAVFECKKYKEWNLEELINQNYNFPKWFNQLERDTKTRPGILVFERNYGTTMVAVDVRALSSKDICPALMYYTERTSYVFGTFDKLMPMVFSSRNLGIWRKKSNTR